MDQKKTEKADLENKRGYFLEIGLVVTLLIMWGVFEYSSKVERAEDFGPLEVVADEEELAPVTRQEELQLPRRRPRSRLSPTSSRLWTTRWRSMTTL